MHRMDAPAENWIARHGAMRLLGEFSSDRDGYARGDEVVLRTDRGHEAGVLLCQATPSALEAVADPTRGRILRALNEADLAQRARQDRLQGLALDTGMEFIERRRLQMELVDVECLLGGERMVFYFLAEKRVDFRELVKDLAREYQTRIEMRQIGVRDEAKLLADYGDCGKPVCCNTHMATMPPVTMRMAKMQKSTLDPNKISGRCGRLKCCLRFEQDVYEEYQAELPPPGSRVLTAKGQGRVLANEVLARKVLVEFEDGRRMPVPASEILSRLGR